MVSEGWLDRVKVHAALVLVGAGYAGYFVLTKASLSGRVDPFVFGTYRDCIGCITLFLYASCFEREHWPKMTLEVAGYILAMAFIGIYLQQLLFMFGLIYTDVIYSSLVLNCVPVSTLTFAVLFRNDKISPHRRDGQAKMLGILCCVIGATILTLYKGPAIIDNSTPKSDPLPSAFSSVLRGRKLGALSLIGCSSFIGLFINLQALVMKKFPASFTLMSLTALVGTPMFAITALFRVGLDPSEWILPPGPDLFSAIYAGTVASGLCLFLGCWATHKGGPTLLAAYAPVQTVFSTLFGVLFLGSGLFLGSFLGAAAILSGLFLVNWGVREGLRLRNLSLQIPTHGKHNANAAEPPLLLVEPLLA